MPDSDFDQIARRMSDYLVDEDDITFVTEQLRLVWNARGAADIVALEPIIEKLGDTMHPDNARVFVGDMISTVNR
jgi:hypothetical protein